ncbi:hypothetical protein DL96DRAFT_1593961 [Flagelloscypha sp. PMI_526]|nr:hypothetical protein DL96DRAFT_1593961 [Flagelloscypha sp. PMI_526]
MTTYNYPGQPPPFQIQQFSPNFFNAGPPSLPVPIVPTGPVEKQRPGPAVSAHTASQAMRRLVAIEMREVGFSDTPVDVMQRIEREVEAFVLQIFERAQAFANLSDRSCPHVADLAMSCTEVGITPSKLRGTSLRSKRKVRKRKRRGIQSTPLLFESESRHASPELLSSDDEGPSQPSLPVTLRYQLQTHFPPLPPKHTYLRTPAIPPKKAALPSLEKKLKTANLVQKSLQNLLTSTEDSEENRDAELLGHSVNWQSNAYPRKRWKV